MQLPQGNGKKADLEKEKGTAVSMEGPATTVNQQLLHFGGRFGEDLRSL